MPFDNLNNNHYTQAEKTAVVEAISTLETVLAGRFKNLSPEERKRYGSINEQNKLIVNKVLDYRKNQSNLSSPDVDWEEFQNDYDSRSFLQETIAKLQNLISGLDNNKILHDFDNYQASLTDYGYSQYKAGTKIAGFETKVTEISQFFSRTATANNTTAQNLKTEE
ncbi:hypothetical protein [Flavobacterium sp.]|uniref:hypothetical protein n=1 Tax=Flavobacterium sp. TaxID=239 RepID=UPI0040488E5D